MSLSVPIDVRDITVTPLFRYETREDILASQRLGTGEPVMVTREVVEVRIGAQKNYSPVFPADAQWRREGDRVITYAERWPEQYAAFQMGSVQRAAGTALEMLRPYGISDAQLSLCRALKVYSIEALVAIEGQATKNLGMAGNDLKRMAREYMEAKANGGDLAKQVADLKAQIAAMAIPKDDPKPEEIEAAIADADAEKEALKVKLTELTGARPRGNPSVETLRQMVSEAQ
jgi:hypothetical protein